MAAEEDPGEAAQGSDSVLGAYQPSGRRRATYSAPAIPPVTGGFTIVPPVGTSATDPGEPIDDDALADALAAELLRVTTGPVMVQGAERDGDADASTDADSDASAHADADADAGTSTDADESVPQGGAQPTEDEVSESQDGAEAATGDPDSAEQAGEDRDFDEESSGSDAASRSDDGVGSQDPQAVAEQETSAEPAAEPIERLDDAELLRRLEDDAEGLSTLDRIALLQQQLALRQGGTAPDSTPMPSAGQPGEASLVPVSDDDVLDGELIDDDLVDDERVDDEDRLPDDGRDATAGSHADAAEATGAEPVDAEFVTDEIADEQEADDQDADEQDAEPDADERDASDRVGVVEEDEGHGEAAFDEPTIYDVFSDPFPPDLVVPPPRPEDAVGPVRVSASIADDPFGGHAADASDQPSDDEAPGAAGSSSSIQGPSQDDPRDEEEDGEAAIPALVEPPPPEPRRWVPSPLLSEPRAAVEPAIAPSDGEAVDEVEADDGPTSTAREAAEHGQADDEPAGGDGEEVAESAPGADAGAFSADPEAAADAPAPDASESNAHEPDVAEPDVAEPEIDEPAAAEPDATGPDTAESGAAVSDASEPDASADTTEPDASADGPAPEAFDGDASDGETDAARPAPGEPDTRTAEQRLEDLLAGRYWPTDGQTPQS